MSGSLDLPRGTRLRASRTEYRIDGTLGAGGFGVTYRALDAARNRRVAIKEYFPKSCAGRGRDSSIVPGHGEEAEIFAWGRARFLQEARLLAQFDHPSLLSVLEYFEANGTAYMVLPLVEGDTLDVRWRARLLTEAEARALLGRLLPGLAQIHAEGVIHRDIKPGNIMLPDGDPARAVLIDFGAARRDLGMRSHSLAAIVSPPYSPREQYATDLPEGPATDLYALSATVYRAMFGTGPRESISRDEDDGLPELDRALYAGEVSLPMSLMLRHGLALRLRDRIATVAAMRRLLDSAPDTPAAEATARPRPNTTRPKARPAEARPAEAPKSAPAEDIPWWRRTEPAPPGTFRRVPVLDHILETLLRQDMTTTPVFARVYVLGMLLLGVWLVSMLVWEVGIKR